MLSLLFPEKCVYCGEVILKTPLPICKECARTMPVIKGERCKYCGKEHSACFCKLGDYAFIQNISVLRYDKAASTIIKRFKFGKKPQLAKFLGSEIAKIIKLYYKDKQFDFVTFVPMNIIKRMKRGFNQSELLAKEIGKELNLPVINTLSKKFSFREQKSKTRKERIKNVRGQFKALSQYDDKSILLIDDVFTTGATLSECALMLKSAGALQVYTATFAITYKK